MAEKNTKPQTTYTNGYYTSYDREFSSMSVTFGGGDGLLQLSPIFDEFIGKEPKKGDNVYNHDERMTFGINAGLAVAILEGISGIEGDEDMKHFTIETGNAKFKKQFTIFRPHGVKLRKKSFDNYVLKLSITKEDDTTTNYHILNNEKVVFTNNAKETVDMTVETDLEFIKAFLNQVIIMNTSALIHGARVATARLGSGSSSGGNKKSSSSSKVVEEETDDGDDLDTQQEADLNKMEKSVESEFED